MTAHKCPKDDCDAQCPHNQLACRRHWYSIPQVLRDEVNRTWRRFDSDPEAYLAAREAAVAALNA